MRDFAAWCLMTLGAFLGLMAVVGSLFWVGITTHLLGPPAVGPDHQWWEILISVCFGGLAVFVYRAGKRLGRIA